jgi:hypothetical protein
MAAMSRSARISKVADALADLPAAVQKATVAERNAESLGHDEASILALWEVVETLGAVVHRQSRILAGKSRGG